MDTSMILVGLLLFVVIVVIFLAAIIGAYRGIIRFIRYCGKEIASLEARIARWFLESRIADAYVISNVVGSAIGIAFLSYLMIDNLWGDHYWFVKTCLYVAESLNYVLGTNNDLLFDRGHAGIILFFALLGSFLDLLTTYKGAVSFIQTGDVDDYIQLVHFSKYEDLE